MFEDLPQEIPLHSTSISGGATKHPFGFKTSLMLPRDAERPSQDIIVSLHDAAYDCVKTLVSCYEVAVVGNDEATQKGVAEQLENFRNLFRMVFAEQEARNTYSNNQAFLAANPAIRILSPIGWTTVHWRKRVIAIKFDGNVVSRKDIDAAVLLLGLEDNTHLTDEVHAYSYAEARKIINAVEVCSLARRTNAEYVAIDAEYSHGCGYNMQVFTSVESAIKLWMERIYDVDYGAVSWYNIKPTQRLTSYDELLNLVMSYKRNMPMKPSLVVNLDKSKETK